MMEPVSFPVDLCPTCGRDVLVGVDLDDADALVRVCTRCGEELGAAVGERRYAAASLSALGYALEGSGGCGSGGCGTCSSGDS